MPDDQTEIRHLQENDDDHERRIERLEDRSSRNERKIAEFESAARVGKWLATFLVGLGVLAIALASHFSGRG